RGRQQCRHEAAAMIKPLGITFFRNTVADEGKSRRAKSNQFVRIHGKVRGVLAAKGRIGSSILHKVASHPVILAAGETFDGFPKVAAKKCGATFSGGSDEHGRKARIECHGD